ncbi:hypothetical protein HYPSUDRAFT_140001, partial [Hypholoma sublateritium FD-334 SS-4]
MAPSNPSQEKKQSDKAETSEEAEVADDLPFPNNDHWTYPVDFEKPVLDPDDEWDSRSHLLISMEESLLQQFREGYVLDPYFKDKYVDEVPNPQAVITPSHFRKSAEGLLYFVDADWNARLCVPKSQVGYVLSWIHDEPFESAHAG